VTDFFNFAISFHRTISVSIKDPLNVAVFVK